MGAIAKSWHLLSHDAAAIQRLATTFRVSPILAQLLLNRGLTEGDSVRRFLDAPLSGLHAPSLLPGVAEAAERLHRAVTAGKRICIYGDYDVDGTTGTAILWQALRLAGGAADFYVPHRLDEGYGLNLDALRQLAKDGAQVIVTVDCGITAIEEAEEARRLGVELIITDHHEMRDSLPDAAVIVHPRRPDGSYPFAGLSGSGVAFKLAWAFCQKVSGGEKVTPRFRDFLVDAVALAALGLVADSVPLRDENRIFVRHGLARLRSAPTPGLKALLQVSELAEKAVLLAEDVSFRLAPRLNAAGRLGCARLVVELLTTTSEQRAIDLARFLDGQNQQRQTLERRILSEAREQAESFGDAPALVLASSGWHAGVIGIVAGRLTERFGRPVLMIALSSGKATLDGPAIPTGQGSGRSIPGFPLHEALCACGEHLRSHGGHAAAAGFSLTADRLDAFRAAFTEYASRHFPGGPPPPGLLIDAEVPLSALTTGLVNDLQKLEPYGAENRRPYFLAGGLSLVGEPARMGAGERHMHFRVRQQQGAPLRAVAFGMGDRLDELVSGGGQCNLVFTPKINEWQGFRRVELEVHDFQPGPRARLA